MALLPILTAPDPRLKKKSTPVEAVDDDVRRLMDDMLQTMYAAPGIGLAAPQVGESLRIFVIDLSLGKDPTALHIMINPEFVERDGMQLEEEGCLSAPGSTQPSRGPTTSCCAGLIAAATSNASRRRACSPVASSTRWITSTGACSSIDFAGCRRT